MASLNRVFLIGRLTQDPELRYTPNGAAVTDLRLAVNRVFNTREGDRREEVLFVDVTVWNRQAETCCQYLKKGAQAHIEGFLRMDTWDDRTTGEKRSKIKVEADRVQFLDGRRDDSGSGAYAAEDDSGAPAARYSRSTSRSEDRGGPNGPSSRGSGRGAGPASGASSRRQEPLDVEPDSSESEEDIPF